MTFLPQVLSKIDSNNSGTASSLNPASGTDTTGFNSIIVTITSTGNSNPAGIQIQFSDDNTTFTTYYTDTYLATGPFTKSYPIIKKYWKISYSSSTSTTITSRLSTNNQPLKSASINSFDNSYESSIDAFGKLRVSNPQNLLELRFPENNTGTTEFLKNNEQVSYYSSTNPDPDTPTNKFVYGNSKLEILIDGSNTRVAQSRNFCTYQPGKSLLFLMSAVLDAGNTTTSFNASGTISRVGYFNYDSTIPGIKNGIYFQYTADGLGTGTIAIVYVSNGTTIPQITQDDWNIDKMDGTGNSGLNLEFTKAQLFVIDFEWLGVGRIRFGFYAYGRINYCHEITNINELTSPYVQSINLPVTSMLVGTGSTGTRCGLIQICSTVISEGGYLPTGKPFTINSPIAVPISATETFVLALRGGGSGANNNYYHQAILPTSFGVSSTGASDFFIFRVRIYRDGNAFYSGGTVTWSNVDSNSVCEYAPPPVPATGTLVTTNSTVLSLNYAFGKGTNSFDSLLNTFNSTALQLTANIQNVADVLVITAQQISSGTVNVYGQLAWQEIY